METFTKRVKAEHWRRIAPKFDETTPAAETGTTEAAEGALDALRLFKDGMMEVEAEEFCESFRSLARQDILFAGTGLS